MVVRTLYLLPTISSRSFYFWRNRRGANARYDIISTDDQNLPLFEESVKTINISRPADIAASEIYSRYKEIVESQLSNQTGM